jgi:hypothetical protein
MRSSTNIFAIPIVKGLLVAAALFALTIIGIKVWFKYNARTILKEYISNQSDGKVKLELSSLNLNLLANKLQVYEADLVSTDSLHEPVTYHVTFRMLSLHVTSVWDLLLKKKLLLDTIKLQDPLIEVLQWRKDSTRLIAKDELSIPQEMGKVYKSMVDALDEFGIRRIIINNASFRLTNKMKPTAKPVIVSKIFFDLVRSQVDKKYKYDFRRRDQAVQLITTNQNISLPGGRHTLSFKSFNLQLRDQRVELDSCTVTASATDSVKSNYRLFFNKLWLVGVDFNAMSAQNVIKADSVYCEQPFFDFDLYQRDVVKKKTKMPDANEIIRELSGNLDLAYAGVKNAGIHVDIFGKTNRSFFNSNKDNFEMRGLRINPDSADPVAVKRFEMLLRDYHLYNEDSSSAFTFDSLHLLNSKIALNNFSYINKASNRKFPHDINIKVPGFELADLDWYELIFEQNLNAKEIVLTHPVINFIRQSTAKAQKKIKLFEALHSIDSLVSLDKLIVNNGQVNMQLGPATSFNIHNVDFSLHSNKVLGSTNKEGIRNAIQYLAFSKGVLKLKDVSAQLYNASYNGENVVNADKVFISGKGNKIQATVNNVRIDNLQLDDDAENIEVDALDWKSASLALQALPAAKNSSKSTSILLKNVAGNNTALLFTSGPISVSTFVRGLHAASIFKNEDDRLTVEGFSVNGDRLQVKNNTVNVTANSYNIVGNGTSGLSGLQVQQIKGRDSINILSPAIYFTTSLNDIFANNFHIENVKGASPVITINKWDTSVATNVNGKLFSFAIDSFTASQPVININIHKNDSTTSINIPSGKNSLIQGSGIKISEKGTNLASLKINSTDASFAKATGDRIAIENGKVDLEISDIDFAKKEGKTNWSAVVNHLALDNANGLHVGKAKSNLRFNQASFGNLNLSSAYLPDFSQLMKANLSAWLHVPEGRYVDSNTTIQWYNAKYNNSSRALQLDSFIYHPTMPLSDVPAKIPYQVDYITLHTGPITINGFDVEQYKKDSSFIANSIVVVNPLMTVFRDKLPPFSPVKKDKNLPVDIIKNIPWPVEIKTVQMVDGTITYGEKNRKSRKEGTLVFSNLNGSLSNIKNRQLSNNDSLALALNGNIMDSAKVSLVLKEAYLDTLSGFLLTARIKPAPLSIFNPVTVPLSNIKLTAGRLDSVSLRAIGRKDVALGFMNMYYQNLKVLLINNGDANQSTFMQDAMSFLANTFVVKNKNTSRSALMYFKHERDQSFTNYIVKMTMSGLATSIGLKRNNTYMKQYKRALRDNNNSPIKLD